MAAFQDDYTQRKGCVVLVLNVGPARMGFDEISFLVRAKITGEGIPWPIHAFHYIYDQAVLFPLVTTSAFLLRGRVPGRFLTHYGKYADYTFKLQTYGIPTLNLPVDEAGNVLTENHSEWINNRRIIEEKNRLDFQNKISMVLIPRRFDVLLGKGKLISESTGNLRAFHIVAMNRERYEKAGKFEKTHIAEKSKGRNRSRGLHVNVL